MAKKRNIHKWDHKTVIITVLIMVMVAFMLIFSFKSMGKTTGGIVSELEQQNSISSAEIDFPDTRGGTFTGWAGENYFVDAPPEVVVLFTSATVPGLSILYYPYQERIVVGTPQMVVEGINLFNGQKHMVSYSFTNGGEQKFFYDGQLVANSAFELYGQNSFTGMAVLEEAVVFEGFEKVEIS
ncbi:MAG: hypothetical protein KKH52_02005 [Nanoarchaeota archaeon]|nr:hypothetical protein [Nanoarchaeota archaeon]MBU1622200.1 hypothetical protein [Nanoarchaeota archaeon]MBU1974145.1 hypothetical protein [Nanoarchaeota archaeon]